MKKNLPVTQDEVHLPSGKYIVSKTDLKGAITYANDTFVEVSGFTREELIGQNHNMVRHPDMPPQAFADLWRTIQGGRPWRGIVKNRCKNGDFYWVKALVVPVRKDSATIGYMSVRTVPTRKEITDAETLYRQLNASGRKIPEPGLGARASLRSRLMGLTGFMVVVAALMLLFNLAGESVGLPSGLVDTATLWLNGLVLLAGGYLIYLQRSMLRIVGNISGRLDRMAQGDLTDEIPLHRLDELGKLNDNLVVLQSHYKTMMSEIGEASNTMADAVERLNAQMDQTRDATTRQSDAVAGVAAAIEQMTVSIREVVNRAQETSASVSESSDLLQTAERHMDESRAATTNVVQTVEQAGSTMSELFQATYAIGSVTKTIQEIADQTNLLALNAAIEAARAGESGRGFAVVADEVRKLAERAASQTHEITRTVSEIQRVTQIAVTGMEAAGNHVAVTNQAMAEARQGLEDVASHEAHTSQMSQDIVQATREQSDAAESIARQAESIVASVDQTQASVDEVCAAGETIRGEAAHLRDLVAYFRYIR